MTEKTKQHLRRYVVFAMGMIIDSIGIVLAVLICGIAMKKTGKKESYGQ